MCTTHFECLICIAYAALHIIRSLPLWYLRSTDWCNGKYWLSCDTGCNSDHHPCQSSSDGVSPIWIIITCVHCTLCNTNDHLQWSFSRCILLIIIIITFKMQDVPMQSRVKSSGFELHRPSLFCMSLDLTHINHLHEVNADDGDEVNDVVNPLLCLHSSLPQQWKQCTDKVPLSPTAV